MEHEVATGRGAGDVAARGDGRSRVVDVGEVGDPVLDGEREADDSWWVPMTFSQGIIGARREGVGAPLPSPISTGRHDVAAPLLERDYIAASGERTGKPMRAIVVVGTPAPSTSRRESGSRSLNSRAR